MLSFFPSRTHLEGCDNRPENSRQQKGEEPEEGREDEDDHLKVDTINIVFIFVKRIANLDWIVTYCEDEESKGGS